MNFVLKGNKIARSLKGFMETMELLKIKNVDLVSLDFYNKVDTTSPIGKTFFQIAVVFAELEHVLINARTKKIKKKGIKFGCILRGSTNLKIAHKTERIEIFSRVGKSYDWIATELLISKKTIADIKKSVSLINSNLQLNLEENGVYACLNATFIKKITYKNQMRRYYEYYE